MPGMSWVVVRPGMGWYGTGWYGMGWVGCYGTVATARLDAAGGWMNQSWASDSTDDGLPGLQSRPRRWAFQAGPMILEPTWDTYLGT